MTNAQEFVSRLQAALGEQYRIERELGHGGMGVVFLATDTTLDRPVAVKVVHPELAMHPTITQRFLAEARMIARLRHPSIVTIHTAGETTGLFYYVMDYVPGESLRQRLTREGRLDPAVVSQILVDLADALNAAGSAGLVHRDLKPENVLLDSGTGRALLADFGIARAMAMDGSGAITGQGLAVGTPTYMSPEQAAGEPLDPRSDLYSLGVLGYEMLAGVPPFRGLNGAAVAAQHLSGSPRPITLVRADTPVPLAAAITRALEKSPERRWQTGEAFRAAILSGGGDTRNPRRRRRWAATAIAVLLIAVVSVALAGRRVEGPPRGVNPRHSILVLPFDNQRNDETLDWLRAGSVGMLTLSLSQWNDLTVIDQERVHDLLAKRRLTHDQDIGLEQAREMAREAGVWTVVLGSFDHAGDSLLLSARVFDVATGRRLDVAQVEDRLQADVRPLFDRLTARLLDLSGAPEPLRQGLAQATTSSLEAFRSYLDGVERLNHWDLVPAEQSFAHAVELDTTFGLAYYKLAFTRGWIAGSDDSIANRAIAAATRHAASLPAHDQTIISAYRAFLGQNYEEARTLYLRLLERDSNDVDAWYGLGEAWFHDMDLGKSPRWTEGQRQALRAFRRTQELDPSYSLAYEHLIGMLIQAARAHGSVAILPGDSFVEVRGPYGQRVLDSTQLAAAIRRASSQAVSAARRWVAAEPETQRAHEALIDAYVVSHDYPAALAEVQRLRESFPPGARPDLPFIEGRIRFASGDLEGASAALHAALDSLVPEQFARAEVPVDAFMDLMGAANMFLYMGDVTAATRVVDLGEQVRTVLRPKGAPPNSHDLITWRRALEGNLLAALGAPTAELRRAWREAAELTRSAPATQRTEVAFGVAFMPALGLLTGLSGDTVPVHEVQALTDKALPPEIVTLLALARRDTAGARRVLAQSKPMPAMELMYTRGWGFDSRPVAAQASFLLGDYQKTVQLLEDLEPSQLHNRGFDPRWGILGRVRLLRGAAYEKLGRTPEARAQYQAVVDQWRAADPALEPYLNQARLGLARVTGVG